MKNKEKFAKEIVEIAVECEEIAVDKNGNLTTCRKLSCEDCAFKNPDVTCYEKTKQWAEAEYVEPKDFTEEEKAFIRACDKIKYMARDKDGNLYIYRGKPIKSVENGIWYGSESTFVNFSTSLSFSAIKTALQSRLPQSKRSD